MFEAFINTLLTPRPGEVFSQAANCGPGDDPSEIGMARPTHDRRRRH